VPLIEIQATGTANAGRVAAAIVTNIAAVLEVELGLDPSRVVVCTHAFAL
jgi:hypothetical protein